MGKALCLLLITLAIYYPALSARMVADDFILVHQVTFPDAFHYLRATFGFGRNEYRPVTALSWAFSNFLWSDDPRGYHLENILLHGANAALLFHWIRGLTQNGPMAFVAALFFIVHPIHHSRVTWISARDALISSLFLLLALHTYTTYRQSAVGVSAAKDAGQKRPPLPLVLSLGFFVLSLLSYEGAIILPLMLLLLELFFFGDTAGNIFHKLWVAIQRLRFYIGLAFVYVCFWLILFRGSVVGYDLSLPITSISGNYYALLYRLFHGHQRLAGVLYALLVVIGYGTLRRRRSLAVFSLLWMLAAYLPFCMIRGFADRFAYVSG
ncbi:MAG: hypothetical protein HY652_08085, partial [Acidobacteria bacterium]|nr:hypothetical protein [Acidobacteriota bacterium]